jgi:hypothetical protein
MSRAKEFWEQLEAARRLVEQNAGVSQADLLRDEFEIQRGGRNADVRYEPISSRVQTLQYWKDLQVVRAEWVKPAYRPYLYFDVSPSEWRNIMRSKSAGRAVTRILDQHTYGPE